MGVFWTCVLMSGCAWMISSQGVWMECAGSGGRCLVQGYGWSLVWCVWVQGDIVECEGPICQASRWVLKLLLELTMSPFLPLGWVARPPRNKVPSKEWYPTPGTLVRAPSPQSPAEKTEGRCPLLKSHSMPGLFWPHPLWVWDGIETVFSEWAAVLLHIGRSS